MPGEAPGGSTSAVVSPVGAICELVDDSVERTTLSTGVIDCVVAVHDSTMSSRSMPTVCAADSCELTSWRSGSSAWAVSLSSSGSVLTPASVTSGSVRLVRK